MLTLRYAARSDVGLVRPGNEDSGYAGPHLLVVADGMGGHAAGELASASAIAVFAALDSTEPPLEDLPEALQGALERVGEELERVTTSDPALTGLGTTLTSISWRDGLAIVTHVGDSRAYLLRDGELQRLTRDHTYVQALVDAGRITEEQAAVHPQRSLITRALDGRLDVEGDFSIRELHAGDRILVCSDGLTGVVTDSRLTELLGEGDPTGAVTTLVDAALAGGASDNVTVVVADVVESRIISGAPVVVGAAGEPGNRDRLPALDFPTDVQPGERTGMDTKPRKRRRPLRIIAFVVAVLAVFAIISALGVTWLSQRYYVGVDGGYVAIFRGIDAAVGPVQFSKPEQVTDISVSSLSEFERQRVEETIPVAGLKEAESTVQSIRDRSTCTGANCP
jgi:protein phosphatase